jgi:hypothetical protein
MKPDLRSVLMMSLTLALAPGLVFSGEAEDQAVKAAEDWLELVDRGEYEESWNEAATFFKAAVTVEQWQQAMNAVRKPLGDKKSRTLSSADYTTSMPGAPDGEYVVILFDASFSNKKTAVETVTPMKDEDGVWRVSGYFIK